MLIIRKTLMIIYHLTHVYILLLDYILIDDAFWVNARDHITSNLDDVIWSRKKINYVFKQNILKLHLAALVFLFLLESINFSFFIICHFTKVIKESHLKFIIDAG